MDFVSTNNIYVTIIKTALMVAMKITALACMIVLYNVRQVSVTIGVTYAMEVRNVLRAMMK